jgi:hypothetical protein
MNLYIKFRQGKGDMERDVIVNMDQVCHITGDGATGSVLTYAAVIQDEALYICVNESPEQIWSFILRLSEELP